MLMALRRRSIVPSERSGRLMSHWLRACGGSGSTVRDQGTFEVRRELVIHAYLELLLR
jgi:hypothetical protein